MIEQYSASVATTIAILLVYFWAGARVGVARVRYQVMAPAVSGDENFERAFRAHQNTLEYLVMVLPAMWLCAWSWGDTWGAIGGSVWILGRIIYVLAYSREAERRALGFAISGVALLVLLLADITHWAMGLIG